MRKKITIPNVDIGLLRKQANALNQMIADKEFDVITNSHNETESNEYRRRTGSLGCDHLMQGISNMLDEMLDIAEAP